jgi:lysozyme family protein
MNLTFEDAFDRLISHEGSYVNNPLDPGGETKFGISKRSYPLLNIATLDIETARAIYKKDFWNQLGDDAHPSIKFQAFDFAVNSGIQTAIRKLQLAIGVADDGNFGPISRLRLSKMPVSDVLLLYLAARLEFMTKLSTWDHFGRGWAQRIAKDMTYAAIDNEV